MAHFAWRIMPAALPVLVSACGSGQTVSGGAPQPTATLAQIQQQIFTPHCASCHVDGGSGPMPLTDPSTSYAALVGVDPTNSTARRAGKKRVAPGDPSRSFLMNKITGDMEFGEGDLMPQNAHPLSADQIALIRQWIQAGAPSGLSSSSPGAAARGSAPAETQPIAPSYLWTREDACRSG